MQASPMAQYRLIVEGAVDPMWLDLGGPAITEQRESGQPVITQLEGRPRISPPCRA